MKLKGKVLIAGGSGFIGSKLGKLLKNQGYQVAILSRDKQNKLNFEQFQWDIDARYIQVDALNNVDYLINLAGTNISSGRWTKKKKKNILESRIKSTELLFENTQKLNIKLKAYIAASAVGYYGNQTTEEIYDEQQIAGTDFLAEVCRKWEEASMKFQEAGIRTTILRTGVVFDQKEGAFPKMTTTLKYGFIAGLGSGKQYIPWIHLEDLLNIYIAAIKNKNMNGAYNSIAPHHITQKDFVQEIKMNYKKVKLPPLPEFILKILLGEMSSILLNGSKVSSQRILDTGFCFKYETLNSALKQLK